MNQEKIGKFIAQCRKEKGLTQAQIAEHFGISNRAVSKWENGKCCPDASIMIELCDILGITVNELLCGERIIGVDQYKHKAEENMVKMQNKLVSYRRRIILNNVFLLIVAVASAFTVPWALIFVAFVMAFRDYYLLKNMKAVKRIIEENKKVALRTSSGEQ